MLEQGLKFVLLSIDVEFRRMQSATAALALTTYKAWKEDFVEICIALWSSADSLRYKEVIDSISALFCPSAKFSAAALF